MKLQTLVAVSVFTLASLTPTFAVESNVTSGSEGIGMSELAVLVNPRATDLFSDTAVSSFVNEQLTKFWEHFSHYPVIQPELAATIISVWAKERETTDKHASSLLAQDVLGRIWQTYHCLVVNRQPLTAEEINRRTEQVRRLTPMLEQLDAELLKGNAGLPPAFLEGLRSEIGTSIASLKEHAGSPAYPLLYRPLSESNFEKVTTAIRVDYQSKIDRFIKEFPITAARVEKSSSVKDNSSSRFLYETLWKQKGATFAALAMGSIVRHYGLLGRNLDYNDSQLFPPFLKVNGAGIAYRMNDGVSMRLSVDENI